MNRAKLQAAVVLAVSAGCLAQEQQPKPRIEQVAWMAGCWGLDQGARRTEEQWMKLAGKSMIGMARTVAGEKTVFTESLQIRENEQGMALLVSINLGKPTVFQAARVSGREVVFENPAHDFPQRIIYRLEADGSLFARIEGEEKGKAKGTDFPMKRVACN